MAKKDKIFKFIRDVIAWLVRLRFFTGIKGILASVAVKKILDYTILPVYNFVIRKIKMRKIKKELKKKATNLEEAGSEEDFDNAVDDL